MEFALLSVWYHKNQFIFNSTSHPFWHNILYHSQHHKYYVLYYVEDDSNVRIPYAGPVKFLNFKEHPASSNLKKLTHVTNKIDYMKLQFIFDSGMVSEKHVLLMDMDCQLASSSVDVDRIHRSKYYLTPYTDMKTKRLYEEASSFDDYNNSFNSYVENYATLINKNNEFFRPCHGVSVRVDDETNHFYMYAQYLQIVQLYMCIFHQYALPPLSRDYNIKTPIPMSFNRGASYYEHRNEYKYEFDYRQPARFNRQPLTHVLYMAILQEKPIKLVKRILLELHRLGYDFGSRYRWSNTLQSDVNVCGCIQDRYRKKFDYHGVEFVLPLKVFNK
ncbi:ORF131 [Betabaculovirus altermyunipunctae]|uniref:ORF131 n=1 Tax=Betabaculovirus altermyunipunctae TaxID=3051996 RepID=A0A1S5YEE3_9BBAC|nr:ORF131 [Betabaculovirus altermyunipunctae]AQQ80398.1 ORF131 [Betabaculovirus altermyunipunctae]